jgi:hypothetical protein
MTVPAQSNTFNTSIANGATTVFPYTFFIVSADDLEVTIDGVVQTAGFTVSGAGNLFGGNVTFLVAPANGKVVARELKPIIHRETDYQQFGDWEADTVNQDFDKIWLAMQAVSGRQDRSLFVTSAQVAAGVNPTLPAPVGGSAIGWNGAGNALINIILSTGTTLANLAAVSGADLIGDSVTAPVAVPYLQTLSQINQGRSISIFRFIPAAKHAGIRAFTNTDDLYTNFVTAVAAARCIEVPYGQYHFSDKFTLGDGQSIRGEGQLATIFMRTDDGKPCIQLPNGAEGVNIEGLTIDCNVTDTAGGCGIETVGTVGQCHISKLRLIRQYNGAILRATDRSYFKDIRIEQSVVDGLVMSNTATDGAIQWQVDDVLSQMNGGHGFKIQAVNGPGGAIAGDWGRIDTFANNGFGIAVLGTASCPLNKFRINTGFLGSDGAGGLYLDTYGSIHKIGDVQVELVGTSDTGPSLAVPASNVGSGFETTGNNGLVFFNECGAETCSYDGFRMSAARDMLNGCWANDNGQASVAGSRNAVNNVGGVASLVGGFFGNTNGGTGQTWGFFGGEGHNMMHVGCNFDGNNSGPFSATSNALGINAPAHLPNTIGVQIAPQAGALFGGIGATGGVPAAGKINTAEGYLHDNVPVT